MTGKSIRILPVDDHPLMRHGGRKLLEMEDDLQPVARPHSASCAAIAEPVATG